MGNERTDDHDIADWNLHRAAVENRADIAKSLIANGVDLEAKDADGCTPLHAAAWDNSLDVARLIVEAGADIEARDDDADTPLHMAAWQNSVDVAVFLMESGANLDAKDESGRTPEDRATANNFPYPQAKDVALRLSEFRQEN
jgi:ankyrin repeat protein